MSVPPPALTITLGRNAYRWPLRICLTALTVGLAVSLSTLTGPGAWAPEEAGRAVAVCGGGAALIALAAAAWAFVIYQDRLIVTIGRDGLILRRRGREAAIPAAAVDAVGITWPVADPVWTVWFDPEAAPGAGAVTKVDGRAAVLLRERSLPQGWLEAVHATATETLGACWRVLDDEGREVDPLPRDALREADHVVVDGEWRYRDDRTGALLAVACTPPAESPGLPLPGRTTVLRDPQARTLLEFRRGRAAGGRVRVFLADGRPAGEIRGSLEPSFHTPDGTLLGTTRVTGGRHVVTGVDGRESATLRIEGDDDGVHLRLERSPSAPGPLRTLALALPMAVHGTGRHRPVRWAGRRSGRA
ncbi:hypothetical protein [Actinomadura livida]|uniref:Uncharacterized protein n=1 Tax=Actinomadura livida TaxID=79909 RepID=A0A7W7MYP1_9ACTN|nr:MULTISPECIES: hypothetical protein [Actinomadura]MBB4775189.1 hypothetical protein [Actinomadura catellatispora]GGT88474.1 hypothetical protein GCM10010208_09020 [Actinomadura livida]